MIRISLRILLLGILLIVLQACRSISAEERPFEHDEFAFTIPAGWETMEEVWDRPFQPDENYYGLGLQEQVMIQYPAEQGKGAMFFAVASSPLAAGENLETRFEQAYESAIPEIEQESSRSYQQDDYQVLEKIYRRPWGEPWWKFRDIWFQKDNMIYVLSFHASPNAFDSGEEIFSTIRNSFQLKD